MWIWPPRRLVQPSDFSTPDFADLEMSKSPAASMSLHQSSGFLRGGRIVSLVPGARADAVWWQDGRIRAVGPAASVHRLVPAGTPEFDFPDAWVTPGFVDGHTHFAAWALNRRRVQLAGARTRVEALRRVQAAEPVQGWVLGQGWDANPWETAPDRWGLDAVQAGPVYLDSLDMHAAWLNSAALRTAGITRSTPDPFGGVIVRDANGEPTGVLKERAVELARPALPEPPDDLLAAALLEAQAEAHRLGVTGLHEVEDERVLGALRRLEAADALRLRVLFHAPVASLSQLVAGQWRSGRETGWLTEGGIKLFLDGSLGTQTAWMLDAYEGSRDRGLPISTLEHARDAVTLAASAGISVAVHAIGDAAVRRALDLLEPLPRVAIPHRIEHFQCVHPDDLGRAARMDVVVSMQPAHLLADIPLLDRHWGARSRGAYAFRSILRQGTTVVFGSDVPVASIDPREGVYAALERKGFDGAPAGGWQPEEKLHFEDAVRAYTVAAAAAAGVSARRGALAEGYDADLVAWSMNDPAPGQEAEAFRRARALVTVVGGEVVMRG
jgi:predicted amidohydrolase YtcJ